MGSREPTWTYGGISPAAPLSLATTAPQEVVEVGPAVSVGMGECASMPCLAERTTAQRFMRAASMGSSSQKCTPLTLVLMAPYGPRMVSGVSGLGSNVSRWLGPPSSQSRMTE